MSADQTTSFQFGRFLGLLLVAVSALLAIVAITSESSQSNISSFVSFSFRAGKSVAVEEGDRLEESEDDDDSGEFTIYSTAFKDGDRLPDQYTCLTSDDEGGVSPPIGWKNPPLAAVQFVLFMNSHCSSNQDRFRYEWVVYNLDPDVVFLPEDNTIGTDGGTYPGSPMYQYHPPCSAGSGNKTYFFRVYALNTKMGDIFSQDGYDDYDNTIGPYMEEAVTSGGYAIANATLHIYADTDGGSDDEEGDGNVYRVDDDADLCSGRD